MAVWIFFQSFILLLAPEVHTPFRQLGAAFHTGMSGKTALAKFYAFMNTPIVLPQVAIVVFKGQSNPYA